MFCLWQEGRVEEVVALVGELDGSFFEARPDLLFELKRCRFLQLMDQPGAATHALLYARAELAPIAAKHQPCLPRLKVRAVVGSVAGEEGVVPSCRPAPPAPNRDLRAVSQ
jgi:hypothetical protein